MSRSLRLALALALTGCAGAAPVAVADSGSGYSLTVGQGIGTASALSRIMEIPVRLGGELLVRFHGDPGTGCAARGVCGYAGAVSWRPSTPGTLNIFESGSRRRSYQSSLDLFGGPGDGQAGGVTSAQVSSGPPTASPTICADSASTAQTVTLPMSHGRVVFTLGQASPGVVQTGCAGPLIGDLGRALRSPAISIGRALRGRITIDLAGSRSFAPTGSRAP